MSFHSISSFLLGETVVSGYSIFVFLYRCLFPKAVIFNVEKQTEASFLKDWNFIVLQAFLKWRPVLLPMDLEVTLIFWWSLLKLRSFGLVVPSNHLFLSCPLLLLPSVFPSITVFPNGVGSLHQVAKVLECQLQHRLMLNECSNECSNVYSELISCRSDWFNLVTEQQQKVKHPWGNWVRASLRAWAGGRVRETGQELRGGQWVQPQGRSRAWG